MSNYYRTTLINQPSAYTNYTLNGSMICNQKGPNYIGADCPKQTMDYPRKVETVNTYDYGSLAFNNSSYNALNSAYPVIVSAPFRLYNQTNY